MPLVLRRVSFSIPILLISFLFEHQLTQPAHSALVAPPLLPLRPLPAFTVHREMALELTPRTNSLPDPTPSLLPPKPPRSANRKPPPSLHSTEEKPQRVREAVELATPQSLQPDNNPRDSSHSKDPKDKEPDGIKSTKTLSIRVAGTRNSIELAQKRRSSQHGVLAKGLGLDENNVKLADGTDTSEPLTDTRAQSRKSSTNTREQSRRSSTNLYEQSTVSHELADDLRRKTSRVRTQPGYVHSTHSPPSSVKGPFENLEEQHRAIAAAKAAAAESLAPSLSVVSPPINPALSFKAASIPDVLKRPTSRPPPPPPIQPSFRQLYSIIPLGLRLGYLIPALLASLIAAGVQPFVATVIGDTFGALAAFPPHQIATHEQKVKLLRVVGKASLELAGAGGLYALCEYGVMVGWTHYGETSTAYLRRQVYDGVRSKPMAWYDTGMGMEEAAGGDTVGSGGLMGKFARETDDVRIGSSLTTGLVVQNMASFAACFILGLVKLPTLALVTLSSLPFLAAVNALTERAVNKSQMAERRAFAEAATTAERTAAAIATVKAYNAQPAEVERFDTYARKVKTELVHQALVWGQCLGLNDFLVMFMFIVGFWYGAILVNQGKSTVAEVMTVFFSCLLGASSLQGISPQLMIINKGKASLASLLTVIQEVDEVLPAARELARLKGEFELKSLFFAYPSRPQKVVLRGVDLFLPCGELTFIVGGSGSGKSTIAHLLLRLYTSSEGAGEINLDGHPLSSYGPKFTNGHIAAVSQGCLIFDMSVHDNVAMGVLGADASTYGRTRKLEDVTRDEVVDACRMALIHEFIKTLPQGYDTMLGNGGNTLSGGQKQRLGIARARIRDPTVLILDEATAALDATARVKVFEALRRWRKDSTTIVITHDLSQIQKDDFVYVMQDGSVVQQGFRRDLADGVFAAMVAEQSVVPILPKPDFSWRAAALEEEEEDEEDLDELARIHTTTLRMSMVPLMTRHSVIRPRSMSLGRPRKSVSESLTAIPQLHRGDRRSIDIRLSVDKEAVALDTEKDTTHPDRHSSLLSDSDDFKVYGFFRLMWRFLPTIPHKAVLLFGALCSLARGAATPTWSFFLAQLMALLGTGTNGAVTKKSGILLGIIAAQGLAVFGQHASLASLGAVWTARLRSQSYVLVLAQDKGWFDEDQNAPPRIVQGLIKDVDDMRHLVATVLPRIIVAVCMVALGFAWAMAVGWQLTLVGLGLLPVFGVLGSVSAILLSRAEVYNKGRREAVARLFFEAVANVRGIRAMALEQSFTQRFMAEAAEARRHAQRAIWTTAIGTSVNNAMPLLAQVPLLIKAKVAAADFERFRTLSSTTSESIGKAKFPISGDVSFHNVGFRYPTRPDIVLTDLSFSLTSGEAVAIVGPSGAGKSTIAALLQRLYFPTSGTIMLGNDDLSTADIKSARQGIAVVSQTPHLFDASVADNIRYGGSAPIEEVVAAAKEARIHDFVAGLPQGYETKLGENASLISGGQAQRLQIARAMLRHAKILILDEATSALDVENQAGILDTILALKKVKASLASLTQNHTTIFITHSVDVMRRCDRIICLEAGRVAEDGTYADLIARDGVFAQLLKTGEWQ
ncbi:hypothetical protein CspeluHIS016_0407520 [Cutaneotrichosporon spelunceum]|uniref:P-loop containing nucleoside triphosphate hydrolase protein n=1 Tax=Cutaneotrichosporon spelunceum TaxID=1672016 RepID=A0AAD3TWA7_9TREE|nr:hypothetical protein CspeluHIS016_0407520 [Cutaneotrichosporon spelunceum]